MVKVKIETEFTQMMGCELPIIVAPMFLVSNVDMVVAGSEAGGIGTFPALNARPVEKFREWLQEIKRRTDKPYGVNLVANRSNIYFPKQMDICLEEKVPMLITSMGNPVELIAKAREVGTKVFCDVIRVDHAHKVVDAGADGLIAVSGGAGGHGGTISPMVLIPYLRKLFKIPVLGAGSVADGQTMAAAFMLGACGVSIGTRFIASKESPVVDDYKQAIVNSTPQDIVTTYKMDGVAGNVINTPYVKKVGTELGFLEKLLFKNRKLRSLIIASRAILSAPVLEKAVTKTTWKQLWGAGQTVGLIDDILSIEEIMKKLVEEYSQIKEILPKVE